MIAVLVFVEDPVSRYIGGSGRIEDSVLSVALALPSDLPCAACVDFGTKSKEEGEKCNGIVYILLLQPRC